MVIMSCTSDPLPSTVDTKRLPLRTRGQIEEEIRRRVQAERARLRGRMAPQARREHFHRPIERPFTAAERDRVTILFGGLTAKHEWLINVDDEFATLLREYVRAGEELAADRRPAREKAETAVWQRVTEQSRLAGEIARSISAEADGLRDEFRSWQSEEPTRHPSADGGSGAPDRP
jgi:hypothetical protein